MYARAPGLACLGLTLTLAGVLGLAPRARAGQPSAAEPDLEATIQARKAEAIAHLDAGIAYTRGEPGGDPEGFDKCAEAFIDLYNEYPDFARADTLLWNAAECFDAAYSFGGAVQARRVLLALFPESALARQTLLLLAEGLASVAYYEDAAQHYEQYAEFYPKEPETPEALQNAYLFRLGLDQGEAAAANLRKFESLYKRKDPKKAAALFWSGSALLRSNEERREHALDYLKTYATQGDLDRQIVAEAVIAQIDWRRSCREPLLYDVCVSVERDRVHPSLDALAAATTPKPPPSDAKARYRPPKRCGADDQVTVTVHKRNAKLADAAQDRFAKIAKLIERGRVEIPETSPQRVHDFKSAWGMTVVYRADARYEDFLRTTLPTALDFYMGDKPEAESDSPAMRAYRERVKRREDSLRRFAEFFEAKTQAAAELEEAYTNVKASGSPGWTLAAAARVASMWQSFADQLRHAPVPRKLRDRARVAAYCERLADVAAPVAERAEQALTYCVERSTVYQYFNEHSRWCEDELRRRQPFAYPATAELFAEPHCASSPRETVGLLSDHERQGLKSTLVVPQN